MTPRLCFSALSLLLFACSATSPATPSTALADAATPAASSPEGGLGSSADSASANSNTDASLPRGDESPWRSGRRLRARVLRSSDGIDVVVGFHDTKLGMNCLFLPTGLDTYHCLPAAEIAGGPLAYVDAACKQPAHSRSTVCDLQHRPEYISRLDVEETSTCEVSYEGYQLEPPLQTTDAWRFGDEGCTKRSFNPSVEEVSPLRKLALGEVVGARVELGDEPGRIKRRFLVAEDGAVAPRGFWDSELEQRCSASATSGSEARCMPLLAAGADGTGSVFADEKCTEIAVRYRGEANCSARIPYAVANGLHRIGPRVNTTYVRSASGACEQRELERAYFTLGEPVAANDLAPMKVGERAGARLTMRETSAPGIAPIIDRVDLEPEKWTDHELGISCKISLAMAGTVRCEPEGFFTDRFLDAACTRPVIETNGFPTPTGIAWVKTAKRDPVSCVDPPETLSRLTPIPAPTALWVRDERGCVDAGAGSTAVAVSYHEVGEEVDPAALGTMELMVE